MEIVNSETRQELKFDGTDLAIEATVLNGNIQKVTINLIEGGRKSFFYVSNDQVRELSKELSNLISLVDKDKDRGLS